MMQSELLNKLSNDKHKLIVMHDKYLIKDDEFKRRIESIEKEMEEARTMLMKNVNAETMEKAKDIMNKNVVPSSNGFVKQENSLMSWIEACLQQPEYNSYEKLEAQLKEWNPELQHMQIYRTFALIKHFVKNGKHRFKNYTWDEDKFQLIKKEGSTNGSS